MGGMCALFSPLRSWSQEPSAQSPAIEIVKSLLKEGCEVRAFDPAATERAMEVLPQEGITYSKSAYEAANGADALLILTDWPEFAKLDLPRLKTALTYPIVVDGRNLHDPADMAAHGFIYSSVGRPDVQASLTRPTQKNGKLAAATQGKAE